MVMQTFSGTTCCINKVKLHKGTSITQLQIVSHPNNL